MSAIIKQKIKKQSGFTMLEVLITMLIMTIGLLGIAVMQIVGLKNNHSAYLRTQATTLTNEYIDILRISSTDNCGCPSADNCTLADIEFPELSNWVSSITILRSANVRINILDTPNPDDLKEKYYCKLYISWEDDSDDKDGAGVDIDGDGEVDSDTEKLKVFSTTFYYE